jgi:hypothetical protein
MLNLGVVVYRTTTTEFVKYRKGFRVVNWVVLSLGSSFKEIPM